MKPKDEPAPRKARLGPTERTRLRRLAERGSYERETVRSILDEGFVCHLGYLAEHGPVVIPTTYARVGDFIYVHGAVGNATLGTLTSGGPVCVTVTLVDGLVLARSAFHHSVNYRSVVIFGTARLVVDDAEKRAAVTAIVDHIVPGRSADARAPTDTELLATRVLSISIEEASAKVRTGGPKDDPEDMSLSVWAGQIPFRTVAGPPITDDSGGGDAPPPRYVLNYSRWTDDRPGSSRFPNS